MSISDNKSAFPYVITEGIRASSPGISKRLFIEMHLLGQLIRTNRKMSQQEMVDYVKGLSSKLLKREYDEL